MEADAYVHSHRLDGGGGGGGALGIHLEGETGEDEDTPQARRERVLAATLRRLEERDKEIEDMCGSGSGSGGKFPIDRGEERKEGGGQESSTAHTLSSCSPQTQCVSSCTNTLLTSL